MRYIEKEEKLNKKIILFGRSLGGAVAIAVGEKLKKREIEGALSLSLFSLIVENSFTRIPDVLGTIGAMCRRRIQDKWESEKRISYLSCPSLFLSGRKDRIINPSMMNALYAAHGTLSHSSSLSLSNSSKEQEREGEREREEEREEEREKKFSLVRTPSDSIIGHNKKFISFPNSGHNDTHLEPMYYLFVSTFILEIVSQMDE